MSKSYKKHLETTPNFKPIVYICAPYRGDKERNVKHAIRCAAYAYSRGAIPITPHPVSYTHLTLPTTERV